MPSPRHRAKAPSTSGRPASKPTCRRGEVKISEPIPFNFSHQALTAEEQQVLLDGPMPERIDPAWPRKTTPVIVDNWVGDSFHDLDNIYDNRVSTGPSVTMNSMRSMPSKSSLDQSQDKPNGFKATIRRMFGSRRRRPSMPDVQKSYYTSVSQASHQVSFSTGYVHSQSYRPPSGQSCVRSRQYSEPAAPHAITELYAQADKQMQDPGDLMAAADLRADLHSPQGSLRPRSAPRETVASARSNPESDDAQVPDAPFAERVSSAYRRRNTLPSLALSEQEQQNFSKSLKNLLGVDIEHSAQDDRPLPKTDNRRSKSASALAETYLMGQAYQSDRQDRNSRVARWRDGASTLAAPPPIISISPILTPEPERDYVKEVPSLEQIIQPAQSFDFGLGNPVHQTSDLEDRVNTLEVKMFDFEYALARLQGVELSKPVLPTKRTRRKSVHEVFSQPSMQSLTTASSAGDRSLPSPSGSPITSTGLGEPFQADRTSKATIRPLRESKSHMDIAGSRTSYHLTPGQFDALIAMIQDEKEARQQMEMHILDLQREVNLLHAPVYAMINDPLPSPDSVKTVPISQKRLHRSPPFRMTRAPLGETSRFSMTESDVESFDDGLAEPFQTPRKRGQTPHSRKGTPLAGTLS